MAWIKDKNESAWLGSNTKSFESNTITESKPTAQHKSHDGVLNGRQLQCTYQPTRKR